jgi:hypothetical protein
MQAFERQGIKNVFVCTAPGQNLTSVDEIVSLGFGKQKAVLTCTQRQQGKRVKGTCHGKLARVFGGAFIDHDDCLRLLDIEQGPG